MYAFTFTCNEFIYGVIYGYRLRAHSDFFFRIQKSRFRIRLCKVRELLYPLTPKMRRCSRTVRGLWTLMRRLNLKHSAKAGWARRSKYVPSIFLLATQYTLHVSSICPAFTLHFSSICSAFALFPVSFLRLSWICPALVLNLSCGSSNDPCLWSQGKFRVHCY